MGGGGGPGGGGGVAREGGRGAEDGGGGGAAGGVGAAEGGGGGAGVEGFRDAGGGTGGFLPTGGGGLGFPPRAPWDEAGRRVFLSAATLGGSRGAPPGGRGAEGGAGAAPVGGLGTVRERVVSGSDRYGESDLSAPVSTPLLPVFRSFGMPTPAKSPASCGAPPAGAPPELSPVSLLLLARLPPGTGGASPPGGFGAMPGTGGAPIGGPEGPSRTLPTCGAERSLTWVTFFSLAPF